jgi:hypothetical protein
MTRKIAALLFLLLTATPAFGLEWQAIPNSTTQAHFDLDFIRCEINRCMVKIKHVHPQDVLAGYLGGNSGYENYGHSISKWRVDCKNNQSAIFTIVDYSVYDQIIDTGYFRNPILSNNTPGSEDDVRWEAICGHIKSLDLDK